MTVTSRTRSVGHAEPAAEFMSWLERIWEKLSVTERDSATMDVRSVDDFWMVGLKWTDDA